MGRGRPRDKVRDKGRKEESKRDRTIERLKETERIKDDRELRI